MPLGKFLLNSFLGLSPLLAREIAYRATGSADTPLEDTLTASLWQEICAFRQLFATDAFRPTLLYDASDRPIEFSFLDIAQYGTSVRRQAFSTFGEMLDVFFEKRDLADRIKQRGQDIIKLVANANARLRKKIDLQEEELRACAEGETFKLHGDLLTANLYAIRRGEAKVRVPNYYSDMCEEITIELDTRLSPAQNAQRFYKKYNKCKNAKLYLTEQIAAAKAELFYLETVTQALERAEVEEDLAQIRGELAKSGYASRMHGFKSAKASAIKPMEFRTSGGYKIVCGKNNTQNDYVTLPGKVTFGFMSKEPPARMWFCFAEAKSRPNVTIPRQQLSRRPIRAQAAVGRSR